MFCLLTINSSFFDIENIHLNENRNIKSIANEMNVGENKLRKLMIAMGYSHDTSIKKWLFKENANNDLRTMSFQEFDELLKSNTDNIVVTEKLIKSNNDITNPVRQSNTSNIFSDEEIMVLKNIVEVYLKNELEEMNSSILDRIADLQSNNKARKTFLIDQPLINRFVSFCEQKRLKMSDVMSIAIMDLLDKYK